MKNSNPVSPVILEGAPAEITISSATAVTQLLNPEVSNYSVTTSGAGAKTITLVRPVSNEATRRLIAKNGCMITFFGKSITGGAVTINFESGAYEDITVASTPVTSHTLTQGEYITFVFVRDTWRLMSEISPASISSVGSLTITGASASSLNFSAQSGGITFNSATSTSVISATNGIATLGQIATSNLRVSGAYTEVMVATDILSILGSNAQSVNSSDFSTATKFIQVSAAASNESVQLTFPTAAQVLAASTGTGKQTPVVDTAFFFSIANTSSGTGNVTIQTSGFADTVGSRVLASQTSGMFAYRFTNVTSGSESAILYRLS